jgi:hypothetical protein
MSTVFNTVTIKNFPTIILITEIENRLYLFQNTTIIYQYLINVDNNAD